MVIKVVEKCTVENEQGEQFQGLKRVLVYYAPNSKSLEDAFNQYEHNFKCENIIFSHDYFDGQCLDSEVVIVTKES